MKTLLAEKLVENEELRVLHGSLLRCCEEERLRLEKRRADCEGIICYLRDRFRDLNHTYDYPDFNPATYSLANIEAERPEIQAMGDSALLRYGAVLRYICSVEADLQNLSLEDCVARLKLAQIEWRRRFGKTVIGGSI
jgi:hypothetical protein